MISIELKSFNKKKSIRPIHVSIKFITTPGQVDLGAMKGYSTLLRAPELEPHCKLQRCNVIHRILPFFILFLFVGGGALHSCIYIIVPIRQGSYASWVLSGRCPWCNGYRRRKWTRRHEFKFWTRLIAFHIALIPLGKVWIQLFSLQLWVNCRTD